MNDVPEPVHLALKRIDTSRRIFFITTAVLFVVVLLLLGLMLAAGFERVEPVSSDTTGAAKMQFTGIAAQMLFTGGCAALVAFHVTRMTKTVLRAMDLRRDQM
jgi:hypothetical protein